MLLLWTIVESLLLDLKRVSRVVTLNVRLE